MERSEIEAKVRKFMIEDLEIDEDLLELIDIRLLLFAVGLDVIDELLIDIL
jgi:hypothetical protein